MRLVYSLSPVLAANKFASRIACYVLRVLGSRGCIPAAREGQSKNARAKIQRAAAQRSVANQPARRGQGTEPKKWRTAAFGWTERRY